MSKQSALDKEWEEAEDDYIPSLEASQERTMSKSPTDTETERLVKQIALLVVRMDFVEDQIERASLTKTAGEGEEHGK